VRKIIALIGLAVILMGAAATGEEKKPDAGAARVAAQENAKTPAGKRYETALEAALESWLRKALERCIRGREKSELSDFEAFVRVGGAGEAEEVVFGAETAVARCVLQDFRDAKYPRPPQPSWWIKVEVQLR
jgi:hypothetical protein